MDHEWQGRALRLRAQGHTIKFIAEQLVRVYLIQMVDVIVYLTRIERERETKQ